MAANKRRPGILTLLLIATAGLLLALVSAGAWDYFPLKFFTDR